MQRLPTQPNETTDSGALAWTTLDLVQTNHPAIVREVSGESAMSVRLAVLGLVEGRVVRVLRKAPFGGPISIRLLGFTLSPRLDEARHVRVTL